MAELPRLHDGFDMNPTFVLFNGYVGGADDIQLPSRSSVAIIVDMVSADAIDSALPSEHFVGEWLRQIEGDRVDGPKKWCHLGHVSCTAIPGLRRVACCQT